jgi:hypothetical protein
MEAYNSVILKETEDQAKQDSREGFPSHEEDKHEADIASEHEFESSTNEPERNEEEKSPSKWDETYFLRNNKTGEFYTYEDESEAKTALEDYYGDEDWCLYKGDEEVECEDHEDENSDDEHDPFHGRDAEADGDALASAGYGTDEDYGYYGGDEGNFGESTSLTSLYDQVLISEAKKGNNPFGIKAKDKKAKEKEKEAKKKKVLKKKKVK